MSHAVREKCPDLNLIYYETETGAEKSIEGRIETGDTAVNAIAPVGLFCDKNWRPSVPRYGDGVSGL